MYKHSSTSDTQITFHQLPIVTRDIQGWLYVLLLAFFPLSPAAELAAVTTEVMRSAKILMQVSWEKAESLLPCLCPCSAGSTCSTECFQAPSRDVLRKQKRLEYFVDLSLVFLLAWLLRDKQAPSWFNREIQAIFSTWSTQDLDAWSVQAWSCF